MSVFTGGLYERLAVVLNIEMFIRHDHQQHAQCLKMDLELILLSGTFLS